MLECCLFFVRALAPLSLALPLFPDLTYGLLTSYPVELLEVLLLLRQILLAEDLIEAEYQREEVKQADHKQQ